jgi:hypothetical protein
MKKLAGQYIFQYRLAGREVEEEQKVVEEMNFGQKAFVR